MPDYEVAFARGPGGEMLTQLSGSSAAQGYARSTLNTAAAQTVNRAVGKSAIVIQVEAGEVSIRTDGSAATTITGQLVGAGYMMRYGVESLSVIETGSSAIIRTWSE